MATGWRGLGNSGRLRRWYLDGQEMLAAVGIWRRGPVMASGWVDLEEQSGAPGRGKSWAEE